MKTKTKDVWVYSAVGRFGNEISNPYGTCEAYNEDAAIGFAVKQLNDPNKGKPVVLLVNVFKLNFELYK